MYGTGRFISFLIAVCGGAVIGLIFNFIKGDRVTHAVNNAALGICGALVGWLFGAIIPVIPDFRFIVTVAYSFLIPVYVLIGQWLISKRQTPIARHIDNYNQPGWTADADGEVYFDSKAAA